MSNDNDIEDIIAQLQRLQLQQTDLLNQLQQANRLHQANRGNAERAHQAGVNDRQVEQDTSVAEVSDSQQDLQVGDQVRIINPGRFQAHRGTVINFGPNRVTIQTANGNKIQRAHHNVVVIEE